MSCSSARTSPRPVRVHPPTHHQITSGGDRLFRKLDLAVWLLFWSCQAMPHNARHGKPMGLFFMRHCLDPAKSSFRNGLFSWDPLRLSGTSRARVVEGVSGELRCDVRNGVGIIRIEGKAGEILYGVQSGVQRGIDGGSVRRTAIWCPGWGAQGGKRRGCQENCDMVSRVGCTGG